MVARDLSYQEYVFEGEEFESAVNEWLERLDRFFKNGLPGSEINN